MIFYISKKGKRHFFSKEKPKVMFSHLARTRGHPSVIIGSNNKEYAFYGITHSPTTRGHKNTAMKNNPNPADARKVYLHKPSDFIKKKYFYRPKGTNWSISPEHKRLIDNFVNMENN